MNWDHNNDEVLEAAVGRVLYGLHLLHYRGDCLACHQRITAHDKGCPIVHLETALLRHRQELNGVARMKLQRGHSVSVEKRRLRSKAKVEEALRKLQANG